MTQKSKYADSGGRRGENTGWKDETTTKNCRLTDLGGKTQTNIKKFRWTAQDPSRTEAKDWEDGLEVSRAEAEFKTKTWGMSTPKPEVSWSPSEI